MKVNKTMCATCPWRKGSPYEYLRADLEQSATRSCSRICHCTGVNAINTTNKAEAICRGARDAQLAMLHGIGFLPAATDEAWDAMCAQMGLTPNACRERGDD